MFCLAVVTVGFTSCDDDDEASGSSPITVTQIYLERSTATVTDRPVDFARLGQTIRIEGSGFKGLKELYVNGFRTYFNTTYITNNNMIVSLDMDTPISGADPEERNTIRFVKSGTEYVYEFEIRAASPVIKSISNTLPKAGETVTVYGENLQLTESVTLPGGTQVTKITNAPEEEDGEWFSFVMPSDVTEYGAITVTCANGTAVSAEYFNNSNCIVLDFDGNGAQGSWNWSETGSMISSDDLVDDPLGTPLGTGRGKVLKIIPDRLLDAGGIAQGKPRATECWTAGSGNELDDWSRMYTYIPETTPLTDVAFQFDIYVPGTWVGTGHIQICLINSFNFGGIGSDDDSDSKQCAFYCPWIVDGEVVPFTTGDQWVTVTIPFSEFGKYAAEIEDGDTPTFSEVVTERNAATNRNFGMGFVNTDFTLDGVEYESAVCSQEIYIDNWRVVPCASEVVSDFPDEEEEEE